MKMSKVLIGMMAIFVSVSGMAADPEISGVLVRQRWPWSRVVNIDYTLSCDPGQSVSVKIETYDGSAPLILPLGSFSGDLYNVSNGVRRIVWDPTMTAYTNMGVISKFRVELTPTPVPLYMIVDLTKSAGESGQVAYVYEEDLTNGLWGAWVRDPITNDTTVIESVIWTGVTTNEIYKTDKLVLRRVPAKTFKMGNTVPPTISTTLTKDFYAGVFEVTQRQYELITGLKPSWFKNSGYYAARPVEQVSYAEIRGSTDSTPAVNWPVTDQKFVSPGSFIGQLRAKTGLTDIDLPTEAQWACLCRAGTETYFNDGEIDAPNDGVSLNASLSNLFMNVIGRYRFNGGFVNNGAGTPGANVTSANATATVGFYAPNAWGLYDTLGNVWELCLDWNTGTLAGGIDPPGPVSGTKRVIRGGGWNGGSGSNSSGTRGSYDPPAQGSSVGFRVVRSLP